MAALPTTSAGGDLVTFCFGGHLLVVLFVLFHDLTYIPLHFKEMIFPLVAIYSSSQDFVTSWNVMFSRQYHVV